MYSDTETDLGNILEGLANFGHKTGNLHEKMIKNISELLDIILDQNYSSDVTNNSELYEADHNSTKTLKDLSI